MYGRGGSKIFNTGQRMRHLKFACVVTLFCVRYLGLSENKVQFLEKAGEAGAMKEEAYLEKFLQRSWKPRNLVRQIQNAW